ncbi:MAG: hypothetical protein IJ192_05950, partial [Clostridia bacterium]|nr:hypothetical protein [Clostridia bacterium]
GKCITGEPPEAFRALATLRSLFFRQITFFRVSIFISGKSSVCTKLNGCRLPSKIAKKYTQNAKTTARLLKIRCGFCV